MNDINEVKNENESELNTNQNSDMPPELEPKKAVAPADEWWNEAPHMVNEADSAPMHEQPYSTYAGNGGMHYQHSAYAVPPQVYYGDRQTDIPQYQQLSAQQQYLQANTPVKRSSGLGVAGLVLGIIGVITSFIPLIGMLIPALALIFGIICLSERRNVGMSITAVIIGVLSVIICAVVTFFSFYSIYEEIEDDELFSYDNGFHYDYRYDDGSAEFEFKLSDFN